MAAHRFILLQSLLYGFGDPISNPPMRCCRSTPCSPPGMALPGLSPAALWPADLPGAPGLLPAGLGLCPALLRLHLFLCPSDGPPLPQSRRGGLIGYTAQYITTLGAFFFPLALVNILRFSIQGMGFSNLAILAGVMEMFAGWVWPPFWCPPSAIPEPASPPPPPGSVPTCSSSPPAAGVSPTSAESMGSPENAPAVPPRDRFPAAPRCAPHSRVTCTLRRPLMQLQLAASGAVSARLQKFTKGDCILVHSRL